MYAQLHSEAPVGNFVCLSVTDTGIGIPPENLSRIFEPFFTKKKLARAPAWASQPVYGIVKQHQGWINVSGEVGVGTTFEVFLPAAAAPADMTDIPSGEATLRGGNERILLVEDDNAVRLMTKRTLENFGYQVLEAPSGRKALEFWPSCASDIELLLTDLVMPDGINGRELAERLRAQTPGLKVIFVSGYSLNAISKDADFLSHCDNRFLQKPYHSKALLETVRNCLDSVR